MRQRRRVLNEEDVEGNHCALGLANLRHIHKVLGAHGNDLRARGVELLTIGDNVLICDETHGWNMLVAGPGRHK